MSRTIGRVLAIVVCWSVGTGASRPAFAQHHGSHHGGHHGVHYGGHYGGSHHGSSYGHGSSHGGYHGGWQHIVPSHHHHSGLYYSYGGANYYTPVVPPVQVQVLRPQIDYGAPAVAAPASPPAPIAPQSVQLEFGGFQQIADLAARLEIEANRWCLDLHYNYRHNPDFAATYGDAYRILSTAKSLGSADYVYGREAIRSQVTAVEPLFHVVQGKTSGWSRDERRLVEPGEINDKAAAIESILHHLLFDVGIQPRHPAVPEEQAPPPDQAASPVVPAPVVK